MNFVANRKAHEAVIGGSFLAWQTRGRPATISASHPTPTVFPETLQAQLRRARILAVLVIDDAADAVPLARALLDGGITAMELTLRTAAALEALRRIKTEVPELLAGVGTVLTPAQVNEALAAGAAFGVAPGLNPRVVAEARHVGLPFAPGICTPSDIELAVEQGCRWLKFFPAEPSGGVAFLKSMAAPYAHLGLAFVPLGGLTEENFTRYLALPQVPAVGGSWLAPPELMQSRDWNAIRENARRAVAKRA
jgi:2-dehydro-3-deoxyphosphogluconate aldolase/(4S)-4-hydroxy-2-oxoglutarate aldolase